ncbi:acyl--CoA ligase [Porticoccaceae bacterium]|nr:acyl--CoA ligase [Porticoccaceae bacterium]MDC0589923.1 acyl--CoA ligase [Porticoccaceae bacterium]|tara:strand:+ start:3742 stop:5436 length:1695 start_codon:yes stop_codon:yes gene_type:complete
MLDVLKQVTAAMTAPGQMFAITETVVRGNKMKTWANAPKSLRDLWLSSSVHGEKDYLVYQDQRWTYSEAHDQVARIANWLTSQDIKQHDRVAIAMRNYPEWILCYWAIASIGAVAVGVNAWWVAPELKYGLNDSQVKMLICDAERLSHFSEIVEEFPNLPVVAVRVNDIPEWAIDWNDVMRAAPFIADVTIHPDDDVCIFYTSGTTGFPKGAQLTHRSCVNQLFSGMFAISSQSKANALIKGEELPDPLDSNTLSPAGIVATPYFHVTATNGLAQGLTVSGGKLVHMYKWNAGEALRLIEQEKITGFTGVPTMCRELIRHPDFNKYDVSSLSSLAGGGAPVQPDLIEKIDGHAVPVQGYGLTETCGLVAASYGVFLTNKPNSAGLIAPVCEIKTVDKLGCELPRGETGEICIYGPHIIKGYLNRPEATAETIVDGWLRTGDIGFVDEDNFVYLVDRAKDMVLRGGENVYCSEVEAAIYSCHGVSECSVFSVPDERLGEEVGAAIFPAENTGFNVDEMRSFLKQKLASFKIPRYIWLMDNPLPQNASGKFLKRELQKQLNLDRAL